jgi:hypothetical protein
VLNDLGYLHVQPLYVFLNETPFLDEQILFKQETSLTCDILCSNTLGSKLLEEKKLCFRRIWSEPLLPDDTIPHVGSSALCVLTYNP